MMAIFWVSIISYWDRTSSGQLENILDVINIKGIIQYSSITPTWTNWYVVKWQH